MLDTTACVKKCIKKGRAGCPVTYCCDVDKQHQTVLLRIQNESQSKTNLSARGLNGLVFVVIDVVVASHIAVSCSVSGLVAADVAIHVVSVTTAAVADEVVVSRFHLRGALKISETTVSTLDRPMTAQRRAEMITFQTHASMRTGAKLVDRSGQDRAPKHHYHRLLHYRHHPHHQHQHRHHIITIETYPPFFHRHDNHHATSSS